MKILQVTNRFYPSLGGVETHVLEISKRFISMAHEVTVISSDFKELNNSERYRSGDKKGKVFGINFIKFWSFRILGIDATTFPIFMPFWLIINIHKFDVVHSHTYGYMVGWLPILMGKVFGVRTVFTPHYSDGAGISKNIKKIYDLLFGFWQFKLVDTVIALTRTEKNELTKYYTQKNNVQIMPNGITKISSSIEYLSRQDLFLKHNIPSQYLNNKLIFSIGRLDKRKGQIYLLEAINILKNKLDISCIIYGSDWGEYKKLIDFKNINKLDNVFILTDMSQEDKHNFLEVSDLFVLPSLQEAFGIVYLEAMQHGVACIGTDAGAIKDVILDSYGSLSKVENSIDLSEKILYELLQKRDKEALIAYANEYDWDIISQNIIQKVYEK